MKSVLSDTIAGIIRLSEKVKYAIVKLHEWNLIWGCTS